jgi:hypothetical protein
MFEKQLGGRTLPSCGVGESSHGKKATNPFLERGNADVATAAFSLRPTGLALPPAERAAGT